MDKDESTLNDTIQGQIEIQESSRLVLNEKPLDSQRAQTAFKFVDLNSLSAIKRMRSGHGPRMQMKTVEHSSHQSTNNTEQMAKAQMRSTPILKVLNIN